MKKNKNTILETAKQTIIAESDAISNLVQYLTKDFENAVNYIQINFDHSSTSYCCIPFQ